MSTIEELRAEIEALKSKIEKQDKELKEKDEKIQSLEKVNNWYIDTKHHLKTVNNPVSSSNTFNRVSRKRTYSITESINNFSEGRRDCKIKCVSYKNSLHTLFYNLISSVPCHHIREYRYAYGAVEPLTGESCFLGTAIL
ncbi:MAG: hypothetical protein UD936_01685 [Acutalibacteraceae bacterium]|nr:hypothetical protein [Acutalibacteraceae bacterium]